MSAYEQFFRQLDEVGKLSRGKSKHRPRNDPELYGGMHPFIQTGDVKHSNFFVTRYTQTYSDKGLAQSKLWPAGTLCITIAANIADTAVLSFPACFPDSIIGFTAKHGVSNVAFIKYCLDTYKKEMRSISQGTTQDNLSQGKLLSLKFRIPDFATQQKIAAILSTYDDLIANNQRRITLLERMAEDIYREWFVRLRFPGHENVKVEKGVPQGWELKKLTDVCTITYGFPFQGDRFNTVGLGRPIIRIRNIPDASTGDFTDEIVDQKYIVRTGDLLIGMDGDFHINHWIGDDAYLVQRSCRLKAKDAALDAYLAHVIRAPINHFQQTIVGATVGHLGAKHLNSVEVLIPPASFKPQLDALNVLLKQKLQLGATSRKAQATRDSLLPRLISGKLAVDALDIRFPPGMAKQNR